MDTEEYYRPTVPKFHKNRLLVRSQIGTGKRCTIPLPPSDFVYGQLNEKQEEGAGAIVLNWIGFKPNPNDAPPKDFVAMNKAATLAGCVDVKDVIKFRKTTTILKNVGTNREPMAHGLSYKEVKVVEKRTHGRKTTKRNDPMEKVISNGFHKDWMSEQGSRIKSSGHVVKREQCPWRTRDSPATVMKKMPIKQTRASRSHAKIAHQKLEAATLNAAPVRSRLYKNVKGKLGPNAMRRTKFKPQVHDVVRAQWQADWLAAKICAKNGDGSYNVRFLEDNTYATVRRLRPTKN